MIQAPRKSNGIELSYEQSAAVELARLHEQLRQVKEWADRAEWRESGSDGLYAILSDERSGERPLVTLVPPSLARGQR